MTKRSGQCLCGAVSFHLNGEPLVTRVCWCRVCQRLSANGIVNLLVPSDALEIVGKMSEYVRVADSGSEIRHRFCANCGTQLFANAPARQQYTVVRAGALDDPSSILPAMNIWTSSAPEWANIDLALECVEKQPVAPQLAKPNS